MKITTCPKCGSGQIKAAPDQYLNMIITCSDCGNKFEPGKGKMIDDASSMNIVTLKVRWYNRKWIVAILAIIFVITTIVFLNLDDILKAYYDLQK